MTARQRVSCSGRPSGSAPQTQVLKLSGTSHVLYCCSSEGITKNPCQSLYDIGTTTSWMIECRLQLSITYGGKGLLLYVVNPGRDAYLP